MDSSQGISDVRISNKLAKLRNTLTKNTLTKDTLTKNTLTKNTLTKDTLTKHRKNCECCPVSQLIVR